MYYVQPESGELISSSPPYLGSPGDHKEELGGEPVVGFTLHRDLAYFSVGERGIVYGQRPGKEEDGEKQAPFLLKWRFQKHQDSVNAIRVADSQYLFTCSEDASAVCYHRSSANVLRHFRSETWLFLAAALNLVVTIVQLLAFPLLCLAQDSSSASVTLAQYARLNFESSPPYSSSSEGSGFTDTAGAFQANDSLQYTAGAVYTALFLLLTVGLDLRTLRRWGKESNGWNGLAALLWGVVWMASTVFAFPIFEKLLLPFQCGRESHSGGGGGEEGSLCEDGMREVGQSVGLALLAPFVVACLRLSRMDGDIYYLDRERAGAGLEHWLPWEWGNDRLKIASHSLAHMSKRYGVAVVGSKLALAVAQIAYPTGSIGLAGATLAITVGLYIALCVWPPFANRSVGHVYAGLLCAVLWGDACAVWAVSEGAWPTWPCVVGLPLAMGAGHWLDAQILALEWDWPVGWEEDGGSASVQVESGASGTPHGVAEGDDKAAASRSQVERRDSEVARWLCRTAPDKFNPQPTEEPEPEIHLRGGRQRRKSEFKLPPIRR